MLAIVLLVTEMYSFAIGTMSISVSVQKLFLLPVLAAILFQSRDKSTVEMKDLVAGYAITCVTAKKTPVIRLKQ